MLYYDEDTKRAEVSCDKCKAKRVINGIPTFDFLMQMLKDDGWGMQRTCIIIVGVEWEHFCPKCMGSKIKNLTNKLRRRKDAKKHCQNC